MSGWIKFWKDMPNDPRVLSAAVALSKRYQLGIRTSGIGGLDMSFTAECNVWRNAVTGALATLWSYADEHIRDDDTLPLTSQTVDAVVGLEGFFDVMPREWIDELDDGSIILPGYCEKNSLIAKRKRTIKSNARVTQWRRANKSKRNGVTGKHVTQHNAAGDQDQDLDQDKRIRKSAQPLEGNGRGMREPELSIAREAPPDIPDSDYARAFEVVKATYPQRAGRQNWLAAEHAWRRCIELGADVRSLHAGVQRYAAYAAQGGVSSPAFVLSPERFFGDADKPWSQLWQLPAGKARMKSATEIAEEAERANA